MKTKKRINPFLIPVSIILGLLSILVLLGVINFFLNVSLRNYIKSFDKVTYENQVIPEWNSDKNYYEFKTDEEFNVMFLSDVHIGGGFLSYKRDKQAIKTVITMIQKEKPDLVIYGGDTVYAVPIMSGTINNLMCTRTIISLCEHLGVYQTVVFGNHEAEPYDYFNRETISAEWKNEKYKTSIYYSVDDIYGESNSLIVVKTNDNKINKALYLIDTNDYKNRTLKATINWEYDYIHEDQINWVLSSSEKLSKEENDNNKIDAMFFFHIPVGEYKVAFEELKANNFMDTTDSKYKGGFMGEAVAESEDEINPSIWFGGFDKEDPDGDPSLKEEFFEKVTSSDYLNTISMICGHDHTNNFTINYKNVDLMYNYSIDTYVYSKDKTSIGDLGIYRGTTVFTFNSDKTYSYKHKNYYKYYASEDEKNSVDMDSFLYPYKTPENFIDYE